MDKDEILAYCYDFYNDNLLIGQNLDIKYYERILNELKPNRVLIVGAGTGRVAIPLSKLTIVDALDLNEKRLKILRSNEPSINTYTQDITTGSINQKYDLVIFPYSTMQLLGGYDNINKALINTSSMLNKNGRIIFDVSESFNTKPEKGNELLFEKYSDYLDSRISVYYTAKRSKDFIDITTDFVKEGEIFSEEERYLYYDEKRLNSAIPSTLRLLKIDDGYDKDFFTHKHLYHLELL